MIPLKLSLVGVRGRSVRWDLEENIHLAAGGDGNRDTDGIVTTNIASDILPGEVWDRSIVLVFSDIPHWLGGNIGIREDLPARV